MDENSNSGSWIAQAIVGLWRECVAAVGLLTNGWYDFDYEGLHIAALGVPILAPTFILGTVSLIAAFRGVMKVD